jgi:hypothetical protein
LMWRICGNEDSVRLWVAKSGFPKITGDALHHEVSTSSYYNPTGENEEKIKPWYEEKARFDENLSGLELSWSIKPSNAKEADISPYDLSEPTLYERCQTNPELSHIFIRVFDFTDDLEILRKDRNKSLSVSIVLPPDIFNRVWNLFNRVLLEPGINYQMCIDFHGWMRKRHEDEPEDLVGKHKDSWLTMEEFAGEQSYYCNDIDFSVFREKIKPEENENAAEENPLLSNMGEQDAHPSIEELALQELLPILSTIKRSLRWITFLLLMIAATLIFK